MTEEYTSYIVNWTDSINTVEGAGKTRHFAREDAAIDFANKDLKGHPGISGIKITKQHTTIRKEVIYVA